MQMPQFSTPVRSWFAGAFAEPTQVQREAWRVISGGESALVIAPTGSGKTLAAFLWAIDRLAVDRGSGPGRSEGIAVESDAGAAGRAAAGNGTRVLYVSPLKAWESMSTRTCRFLSKESRPRIGGRSPVPNVTVGVRFGDTTTASQRRQLLAHLPDVLITTPESLYLMLISAAARKRSAMSNA